MSAPPTPPSGPAELGPIYSRINRSVYCILITCSVAVVAARVLTVGHHGARGDSPFFSANDRSRWCTIRALGDHGVYEIDDIIDNRAQAIDWDTIDKVRHVGRDGDFHFYSSKPTLLPTLLAGLYGVIKAVSGKTLEHDPRFIARVILLVVNVIPWAIYLVLLARLLDSLSASDWARQFILASAGFGTFLSTFAVTLNNHLPAAVGVMIAVYGLREICKRPTAAWPIYAMTGLFAAFAAANELPALAFLVMAGVIVMQNSAIKSCAAFLPAALLVMACFLATNFASHGEWRLAYSHRGDGRILKSVEGDFESDLNSGRLPDEIRDAVRDYIEFDAPQVELSQWAETQPGLERWTVRDLALTSQLTIVKRGSESDFEIRAWDNWYDYPGSYWLVSNPKRSLVDRGQDSPWLYAFHLLIGHHGIFSLTPLWLFSFAGMCILVFSDKLQLRWLGWLGIVLSVVVIAFYLSRTTVDRNYGGCTSGLRWVFWLAPIWLVSMLPVVQWLGRSVGGRTICVIVLSYSALSAMYSLENPWVHPWLYECWEWTGLPK